ncbi:MAG: hypothetical protein JWO02_2469 [Solirubrobacterales bacterium]|nr:hypothetical protein [Solirubrobacterales bacterium]
MSSTADKASDVSLLELVLLVIAGLCVLDAAFVAVVYAVACRNERRARAPAGRPVGPRQRQDRHRPSLTLVR